MLAACLTLEACGATRVSRTLRTAPLSRFRLPVDQTPRTMRNLSIEHRSTHRIECCCTFTVYMTSDGELKTQSAQPQGPGMTRAVD
jgi:hypothetical protein